MNRDALFVDVHYPLGTFSSLGIAATATEIVPKDGLGHHVQHAGAAYPPKIGGKEPANVDAAPTTTSFVRSFGGNAQMGISI